MHEPGPNHGTLSRGDALSEGESLRFDLNITQERWPLIELDQTLVAQDDRPSDLHEERMATVTQALICIGAESVLDLGCGSGVLLERLAGYPVFSRLGGMDSSMEALGAAERRLGADAALQAGRVALHHGSFEVPESRLAGYDAAIMVETIEHLDPGRLSALEHALFACYRPQTVLITTPNQEYNVLYGLPDGVFRHPGHCFEWTRAKFRKWAAGVGARRGYGVRVCGIGSEDFMRGCPTQMATFSRRA